MNLPAYSVLTQTNVDEGHSPAPSGDAEEALFQVRNFLSLQPSKRWARLNVPEVKNHHHQIRGYGGRGTWEQFRATSRAEHLWWAQKTSLSGEDARMEKWSMLEEQDAPSGWSALDEADVYFEDMDACGCISECITVRDHGSKDGIAGFVSYRIVLYAETVMPKRKRRIKMRPMNFLVRVQQIYVRPNYRRKKFGLVLCFGLSERLRSIVERGLSTQPAATHQFRVEDITLDADCYSEEGYDWMECLEAEVGFWVGDARFSGNCGHALDHTTVTGDFGF